MTAPTPPKIDWVDKDTAGYTAPDWTIPASVHNNIGAWINYLKTQLDGKQVAHALLTAISALIDPNTDKLIFWDDSAGTLTYLSIGTNLSITGTTLNATAGAPGSTDAVPEGTTNLYYTNARADARVVAGITGKQALNANLTSISSLVDPNADRLAFWDDSAGASGAWAWLTLGTNLSITGTTLNAAGGSGGTGDVVGPASATDNAVARYDTATGKLLQNSAVTVDDNGAITALNTFHGLLSTPTAAGITTLTITSVKVQEFTGTTTQTVRLPTTGVPPGAEWIVVNNSTGIVTVQSSGANTVLAMGAATRAVFTSKVSAPTTAANWTASVTGGTYQAPISLTTTGTSGAATFTGNVLNVPQYTAGGGGGAGTGMVNVCDPTYAGGADPTNTVSSGNAFRAAFATGKPVYVPGGNYTFDGAPIGAGLTDTDIADFAFVGDANIKTAIYTAAGQFFIDHPAKLQSMTLHNINFNNGLGCYRGTNTADEVGDIRSIRNCRFEGYTLSAACNRASDSPYWQFEGCFFQAANNNASISVALSGLVDNSHFIGCTFVYHRVGIKLGYGGCNTLIENCSFFQFANPTGGVARCDVWVPAMPAWQADIGGLTIGGATKFGNEFLATTDFRIVCADEGTGAAWESRYPNLTTNSTGWATGWTIEEGVHHSCIDVAGTPPLVYSTTPNLQAMYIGAVIQYGSSAVIALLRLRNATGFDPTVQFIGPARRGIALTGSEQWVTAQTGTLTGQPPLALPATGSGGALDPDLVAIAALTSAANQLPYATAANAWAMTTLSTFARTLIDDADAATMRGTLGVTAAGINPQTGTTYTLALTDANNTVITASNAAAQTYTFPQNSAVAIPIGASGEIHVIGAGQVTCAAGTGATINGRGGALKSAGQYAVIGWRKTSTNGFIIFGDTTT